MELSEKLAGVHTRHDLPSVHSVAFADQNLLNASGVLCGDVDFGCLDAAIA